MKIALMVLMGLPGSGKTTLANNLMKKNHKNYSFIHVCYDNLISTFDLNWKESRKIVSEKIHKLILSVKSNDFDKCPSEFQDQLKNVNIKNDTLVIIVDDNMYYKSMRIILYQIAQEEEISFCQIFMKCSVEDALRNNKNRESKVPPDIIIEMSRKIEMPNIENKWERYSVILNVNTDYVYDNVFSVLEKCLNDPESRVNLEENETEKRLSATITFSNIIHQVDVALRHIIGDKIKTYINNTDNKDSIKNYSLELNTKKIKYLNTLKKNEIIFPDEVLEEIQNSEILKKTKLVMYLEERFL